MADLGWSMPAGCGSTPYDGGDLPETCPVCGGENWDEEREAWLWKEGPFCSEKCEEEYGRESREWEHGVMARAEVLQEWETRVGLCIGRSR